MSLIELAFIADCENNQVRVGLVAGEPSGSDEHSVAVPVATAREGECRNHENDGG
jgi:hypothetical protein